ncbi:MAG: class I SAM-dependent methyltransferase, partial [Terriglobales bacterium]
MGEAEPLLRTISDTALWTALYRARESERPDALFHDPYARRLAGQRGAQIAAEVHFADQHAWSLTARTVLLDQMILKSIAGGADLIVNLAAGLDTRPYRLALPPSLRWVEVDFAPIFDYKEAGLGSERPICKLQRIRLDLAEVSARRDLFQQLGSTARRALVFCEGLLIYFTPGQASALARDLAAVPGFQHWAFDLVNPALLRMLQKRMGTAVEQAGAPFQFGPSTGPDFFASCGWKTLEAHSLLKTAHRLNRLPLGMRLLATLPQP